MSDPSPALPATPLRGRWQQTRSTLTALLLVREDPDPEGAGKTRLNILGHTLLTGALFLTAGVGFLVSLGITQASINRWDHCPQYEQKNGAGSAVDAGARRDAERSAQAKEMINNLTVATRAQRQRLLQQRQEMEATRESFCLISHNFEIQFTAFTSVGTAAAILVTIALTTVAPDGLKTQNRTLLNVLMSSGIILAISVIYPQTFSQIANQTEAESAYQQTTNLLYAFTSALANKQISTNEQNPHAYTPINTSADVATLIRMNDAALAQLTSAKLSFNNQFATKTLQRVNSQSGSTGATPTAATPAAPKAGANPQAAPAPAATP